MTEAMVEGPREGEGAEKGWEEGEGGGGAAGGEGVQEGESASARARKGDERWWREEEGTGRRRRTLPLGRGDGNVRPRLPGLLEPYCTHRQAVASLVRPSNKRPARSTSHSR